MSTTRRFLPILLGVVALFGATGTAHANPSFFETATSTAAATTTLAFMTPGAATTTTPVYDAYAQTTNGGLTAKSDYAGFLTQFTASSTNSILNANVEYSQGGAGLNCVVTPSSCDWYRNFVLDPNQMGTTTAAGLTAFTLGSPFSMSWKFASSTVGGIGQTNTNRSTAAMLIPTPFRYTRVVFSMTGANGAVWAQLVPIKEQR
jgi:hypothetical protein